MLDINRENDTISVQREQATSLAYNYAHFSCSSHDMAVAAQTGYITSLFHSQSSNIV